MKNNILIWGVILIFLLSSIIPLVSSYSSYETNKVYSIHIDDNGTLSGYVKDTSMNPMEGAKVRVYFHETYEENYTDSSGYYHVTNIPICRCSKNATASKEGYRSECVLLSINETTTHNFVLAFLGNTLYVGGSGPGNYSKIQDAVDNASDGDTVLVYSGTYYENVIVDKSINLIGEGKNATVIDGMENGDVVYIIASDVHISGFTIQNSSMYPQTPGHYGVFLESCSGCHIENNIVMDNSYGIRIPKNSNNNIVSGNNVIDSQHIGVWIGTFWEHSKGNNKIYNNVIIGGWTAINLDFSSRNDVENNFIKNLNEAIMLTCSENTTVVNNVIENAVNFGIRVYLSNNSVVVGNTVRDSTTPLKVFVSILLLGSSRVTVLKNKMINTDDGIIIDSSDNNNIVENTIEKSRYGIYIRYSSKNNRIYSNNLIDNVINGRDECNNIWNNGKKGNYWDDYKEKYPDAHKKWLKGIWDTPYEIPAGDNQDRYPLIKPYSKSKPYIHPLFPQFLEQHLRIFLVLRYLLAL